MTETTQLYESTHVIRRVSSVIIPDTVVLKVILGYEESDCCGV